MTTTPPTPSHEVHLAIYDLSNGMARGLSAQFLGGPQHAIDIIPHTAILAYGKEYFFGQGIQSMHPREFRASRGLHPVEVQPLGHTRCTEREFESWCRAQAATGHFAPQSYDLMTRNCNNFADAAARQGLRLRRGVPPWILAVPHKFLSSPLGMVVRPLLEQMQIANTGPTNLSTGGVGAGTRMASTFSPVTPAASMAAAAANPWADIPAAALTTATAPSSPMKPTPATPLLDKHTALLSTDAGVVQVCVDRLTPGPALRPLLLKLAEAPSSWTQPEIDAVHQYLRAALDEAPQHATFALMLMRLIVLKQSSSAHRKSRAEHTHSTQHVARWLLENKLNTLPAQAMAWCVLSNAMGAIPLPTWDVFAAADSGELARVIERAVSDSDPAQEGASSPSRVALRQSAAAFLYNVTIDHGRREEAVGIDSTALSDGAVSILLGCLAHLPSELDATTCRRHLMSVGQLLKSSTCGGTAVTLVKDLGLVGDDFGQGQEKEVADLAKEVVLLLQ